MARTDLFKQLAIRDYSDSDQDNYAQLLQTIFFNLVSFGEEDLFYELLEQAENSGKKIRIKTNNNPHQEEISFNDLELV